MDCQHTSSFFAVPSFCFCQYPNTMHANVSAIGFQQATENKFKSDSGVSHCLSACEGAAGTVAGHKLKATQQTFRPGVSCNAWNTSTAFCHARARAHCCIKDVNAAARGWNVDSFITRCTSPVPAVALLTASFS